MLTPAKAEDTFGRINTSSQTASGIAWRKPKETKSEDNAPEAKLHSNCSGEPKAGGSLSPVNRLHRCGDRGSNAETYTNSEFRQVKSE
jgi:hypothetical protein